MITADTITDEAVRAIRNQALANLRDFGLTVSCDVIRIATHALGESRYFEGIDCRIPHGMEAQYVREARARCAEILNERAKADPFCACGHRVSHCDGSRTGCAKAVQP